MRRYNKIKRDLQELYQQPKSKRWDAVATRMRQRAMIEQLFKMTSQLVRRMTEALKGLVDTVNAFLGVASAEPGANPLAAPIHPQIVYPRREMGRKSLEKAINDKLIPPISITVSQEEQDHIDMLRAQSIERHIAAGHISVIRRGSNE